LILIRGKQHVPLRLAQLERGRGATRVGKDHIGVHGAPVPRVDQGCRRCCCVCAAGRGGQDRPLHVGVKGGPWGQRRARAQCVKMHGFYHARLGKQPRQAGPRRRRRHIRHKQGPARLPRHSQGDRQREGSST
jgi:hypothetical protein